MAAMTFLELAQRAADTDTEAATTLKTVPAGKYEVTNPRFSMQVGRHSNEKSKRFGQPNGVIDLIVDVTDPKLEMLDLPVRSISVRQLVTSWANNATGLLEFLYTEHPATKVKTAYSLDIANGSVNFSKILGKLAYAYGLANGSLDKPLYPKGGELLNAFNLDPKYQEQLGALAREEILVNLKGEDVDFDQNAFVLAQYQVSAVQAVLTAHNKQSPLLLRATITVERDDYSNSDVNRITELFLVMNDEEHRLY